MNKRLLLLLLQVIAVMMIIKDVKHDTNIYKCHMHNSSSIHYCFGTHSMIYIHTYIFIYVYIYITLLKLVVVWHELLLFIYLHNDNKLETSNNNEKGRF
ncbi:uncharacterized protein BX663DRAFT_505358 [Cokeromyces recurvatus]|uniref:uncharacterized protein n=1 Tax=Cokeromyces recurvatus TaxID=90255 RepID=UPI00221F164C|nr:uncharacterized protein BX663DRAFT_505358 [Cokeromyces recurvatus]KAI7903825.1 hypothetical protein BX663DRAFT_505358 [Cokeromyces recurvatus]